MCVCTFVFHIGLTAVCLCLDIDPLSRRKKREGDRMKFYYATVSNLEIMTCAPVRAADSLFSDYLTDAVGSGSRRTNFSVVKMIG